MYRPPVTVVRKKEYSGQPHYLIKSAGWARVLGRRTYFATLAFAPKAKLAGV